MLSTIMTPGGRLGPANHRPARVIFLHDDIVQVGSVVVDVADIDLVFAEGNILVAEEEGAGAAAGGAGDSSSL